MEEINTTTFKYYLVLLSKTMETVSLKMEDTFLENIEKAMYKHNYTTKAEFISEAIRGKLTDLEKQEYILRALKLYGTGKDKHGTITDKDLHRAREKAAKELAQELGVDLH